MRRPPRRRIRLLAAVLLVAAAAAATAAALASRVLYNHTESLPRGFYWLASRSHTDVRRGELVAFPIPANVRALVVSRHYLPERAVLIKHVLAAAGDAVCTRDARLVINGRSLGEIRRSDSAGRPLPIHDTCRPLTAGELFVGSDAERSFDSRNFGPVPRENILGAVKPLWTY